MADNSTADPGAGGDTFRTKDRTTAKTQIVGLDLTPAGGSETLMNGVLPVSDNAGSLTVDAPVGTPAFVRLSDGAAAITALPVTDNAGSLTVDNAGTFAVQPTANATVDVNRIAGTATDVNSGTKSAGTQRVVLATDQPALTNALKVDGSAVTQPVSDGGGSLTVDNGGTFAVQADTELTTADLDTGAGTDTRAVVGLALAASGGAALVGTANPVPISDNAGSITVDNGGTFAVQIAANSAVNVAQVSGTAASVNSGTKDAGTLRVTLATDQVQLTNALKVDGSAVTQPVSGTVTASSATGSVAHDGADSGNPVKTGGRARTTDITAVASDDRTDFIADSLGKQVTLPYAIPARLVDGYTSTALTNTTAADVIAAQGAGTRIYVTQVTITNAHATVGTKVEIRSATTVRRRVFAAANGGGEAITFPAPIRLGDNEALTARNITTGADVDVSASGYLATN